METALKFLGIILLFTFFFLIGVEQLHPQQELDTRAKL